MIQRVEERKEKEEVLDLMEPLIAEWFDDKFDALTEPQGYAIPLIHERKNVLVSSPTGSGKTLTAFLSIINELFKLDKKDELEDKIYCVYVSPLKALANDIHKNLEKPLEEIKALAKKKGEKVPEITTAIRSGDTPQSERRKMVKNPPHILITTPESLALVLSSPKFRESFKDVQYFINDEIHEISSSKRGVYLSLNVERLQQHINGDMTRVGLSATQAPIEEIAKFLGGYENGEPRDVNIIEVAGEKMMDLSVISPVDDMTLLPYEVVNSRMYDELKEMVDDHRTTLIFTNTRSGAENVSYKLQEREIDDIAAHHGSLSKETRIEVEDSLKEGDLEAAVSSTSLELGIDVGYIDLVIQVGSPKSVAKGLQRIGRAGHAVGKTSKGRMIVFEKDDLIECTVLTKQAYDHEIDRVNIPENNLDVLAQGLVGMSLEKRWPVEEAFEMVRRAYCYRNLPEEDFLNTLDYLGGDQKRKVYSKLWYDEEGETFGKKGGAQMIYYLNIGTIPSDSSYRVYSDKGVPLGKLSEKFVERLTKGDVFVLGSRSYEFIHTRGTRVFVKDAVGKKPTVPSWSGEMLPRSYDLSVAIGAFRRRLAEKIDDEDTIDWLMENYRIDKGSAQTIISYFKEQLGYAEELPTDETLLLEGYVDQNGRHNIIFHACFGRRVNDALSRAYAYRISKKYNCSAKVSVTDDNFMVSTKKEIPMDEVVGLVDPSNIEKILRRAVRNTEMFKQRFRHCATRALMILRNYKGSDISVSKQKIRSGKILETLREYEDHPIVKEAYNEILYQVLDLKNAEEVLKRLDSKKMEVKTIDYSDTPSPFGHNVVMMGISDVIMMEDKSALLRQFHQRVLEEVIPPEEIEKFKFEREVVEDYYFQKRPSFSSKDGMLDTIRTLPPIHVMKQRGRSVFTYTEVPFEEVLSWSRELLNEGKIQSVWVGDVEYAASEHVDGFLLSQDQGEQPHGSAPVLNSIEEGAKTKKEIYRETDLRLKDVSNIMRELERKRLVNRRGIDEEGDYRYGILDKKDVSMEAVEEMVLDYLEYEAPRSLEEVAYALDIPEDRALMAFNNLVDRNEVVSGKLVVGEGKQYMLQQDYHNLRFPGKVHVPEEKVSNYLAEKQFGKIDSIEEYFERFSEASMPFDVFHRVNEFSLKEWEEMRENGDIIEGRFLNGRVRYIREEDAAIFTGAYRRERLSDEEEEILRMIQSGEANTLREIKKASEMNNQKIKEIVKKLDNNLYIYRDYTGEEGWSSKNKYSPINVEPLPYEEAKAEVVKRFLKGNGPVSIRDIRYHTGFHGREVESVLTKMIHEGMAAKVRVGSSRRELYINSDELEDLKSSSSDELKKMRILSRKDPYTRPMWANIYSRYGDDWVFPIVKNGRLQGSVEKWNMSGCIEIRHLDLDREEYLHEALDAVEELMEYHGLEGYDIVRVRHYQNQAPTDLDDDVLDIFQDKGYRVIQDMLVKGNIIEEVYDRYDIRSYILGKQKLGADKYSNVEEALECMKGARSDFEIRERTDRFFSIEWMFKRDRVRKGKMIPPYLMYAYPSQVAIYRKAKDYEMDHVMEDIYQIVVDKEPIPLRLIYKLSPFSRKRTKDAVDSLYEGLHLTKNHDNRYISTEECDLSVHEAKKEVIRWVFDNFGVFSAEDLSSYLGRYYSMAEIREILAELVGEDYLVKGFLCEGEDDVYWMLSEGTEEVKDAEFKGKAVITTKDRASLYFRRQIKDNFDLGTCYLIFDGPKMAAGFTARLRSGYLKIDEFDGPKKYKRVVKEWAYEHNIGIKEKKKKPKVSDYEIRKWYEQTRGI